MMGVEALQGTQEWGCWGHQSYPAELAVCHDEQEENGAGGTKEAFGAAAGSRCVTCNAKTAE